MKQGKQTAALLVTALLLTACSRTDPSSTSTPPSNAVSAQALRDKYKDAALATKDYLAQNKDQFVAVTEQRLKELDQKISALVNKSKATNDAGQVQSDQTLESLRQKRKAAGEQLEKLKESTAEGWEKVKSGFADVMADLDKAYNNAKSKLNSTNSNQ